MTTPAQTWNERNALNQRLEEKLNAIKQQIDVYAKIGEGKVFNYINELPEIFKYHRHELIFYYYEKRWANKR